MPAPLSMNACQRALQNLASKLRGLRDTRGCMAADLDENAESAAAVAALSKEIVRLVDAALVELAFHAGIDDREPALLTSDAMADFLSVCDLVEERRTPRDDSRAEHGTLHRVYQGV
jgi:hypothetical protein